MSAEEEIILEPFRKEDEELVKKLYSSCYPYREQATLLPLLNTGYTVLLAKDWDTREVKGFMIWRMTQDEVEVIEICVSPDFQHQGIASLILKDFMRSISMLEIAAAYLEVAKNNNTAIALYKKFGFSDYGVREKYYKLQNGTFEDALLMCMKL